MVRRVLQKLLIFVKSCGFIVTLASALLLVGCGNKETVKTIPDWQRVAVVDQHGKQLTLADLHGKVVLMHLVFTRCMMICPVQMGQLAKIQQQLLTEYDAEDFVFVSVSATPDYDTPERMGVFAERFTLDQSNWRFITGSLENINTIVSGLEAKITKPTADGQINHTSFIYVLDREGKLAAKAEGVPMDKAAIYQALRQSI